MDKTNANAKQCIRRYLQNYLENAARSHQYIDSQLKEIKESNSETIQNICSYESVFHLDDQTDKIVKQNFDPKSKTDNQSVASFDKDIQRDGKCTILISGFLNSGKSTLIRELLRGEINLPTSFDQCTSRYVVITGGESRERHLLTSGKTPIEIPWNDPTCIKLTDEEKEDEEALAKIVQETCPIPLLKSGLIIVDTPGLGGLKPKITTTFYKQLVKVKPDILLYIFDNNRTYSETDAEYMRNILEKTNIPFQRIIFLANKIDANVEAKQIDSGPNQNSSCEDSDAYSDSESDDDNLKQNESDDENLKQNLKSEVHQDSLYNFSPHATVAKIQYYHNGFPPENVLGISTGTIGDHRLDMKNSRSSFEREHLVETNKPFFDFQQKFENRLSEIIQLMDLTNLAEDLNILEDVIEKVSYKIEERSLHDFIDKTQVQRNIDELENSGICEAFRKMHNKILEQLKETLRQNWNISSYAKTIERMTTDFKPTEAHQFQSLSRYFTLSSVNDTENEILFKIRPVTIFLSDRALNVLSHCIRIVRSNKDTVYDTNHFSGKLTKFKLNYSHHINTCALCKDPFSGTKAHQEYTNGLRNACETMFYEMEELYIARIRSKCDSVEEFDVADYIKYLEPKIKINSILDNYLRNLATAEENDLKQIFNEACNSLKSKLPVYGAELTAHFAQLCLNKYRISGLSPPIKQYSSVFERIVNSSDPIQSHRLQLTNQFCLYQDIKKNATEEAIEIMVYQQTASSTKTESLGNMVRLLTAYDLLIKTAPEFIMSPLFVHYEHQASRIFIGTRAHSVRLVEITDLNWKTILTFVEQLIKQLKTFHLTYRRVLQNFRPDSVIVSNDRKSICLDLFSRCSPTLPFTCRSDDLPASLFHFNGNLGESPAQDIYSLGWMVWIMANHSSSADAMVRIPAELDHGIGLGTLTKSMLPCMRLLLKQCPTDMPPTLYNFIKFAWSIQYNTQITTIYNKIDAIFETITVL